MLGGSFWAALLRNGIGSLLMMLVFLLLDRPRFKMNITVWIYIFYWIFLTLGFSLWYCSNPNNYVRFSGLAALPFIGIFCGLMSGDGFGLSVYKVSIGYYLLSVCLVFSVDISRLWFGSSLWADIIMRIIFSAIILAFTAKKFRRLFLDNLDFLRNELDLLSAVSLVVSIMLVSFIAFRPADYQFSTANMIRILITLFMAGIIQYIIFHLYIHLGKEYRYQIEKQMMELNEQFLQLQLTLTEESEAHAAKIRHDARHHCLLIREYAKRGEIDELLAYLDQYMENIQDASSMRICANKAVNNILSAYARYAKSNGIAVSIDVTAEKYLTVRDFDLVAILANIFENAIHGCTDSGMPNTEISLTMSQKGHKIVIQCRNTCAPDAKLSYQLPKAGQEHGIGVTSIRKAAARYDGETDFLIENGMFVARILLNMSVSA